MNIVIPGGSGQVGTILARAFHKEGHQVTVLSRNPSGAPWNMAKWDGKTLGLWAQAIDGADVVINLAGYTVNCRYNKTNRARMMNSRVDSTRVVGEAIAQADNPPHTWLQASTATIYAHRFDAANDEESGLIGGNETDTPEKWNFSIKVAKAWEQELDEANVPQTRKVKLRSAMVMSPDKGGIFDVLLGLVRFGLGGRAGSGEQYVSWIHHEDFIQAIKWLINHEEVEGVINLSSPNPLPYADFMRALREEWGISFGLPATKWMLEIGTFIMRTETELVLKSRRVVPGVLLDEGFSFHHPGWEQAVKDLCEHWRQRKNGETNLETEQSKIL